MLGGLLAVLVGGVVEMGALFGTRAAVLTIGIELMAMSTGVVVGLMSEAREE